MKKIINIPGKTFLFGEYIATQGEESLIFTSEPLFKLKAEKTDLQNASPFHLESPAGKFYQQHKKSLTPYQFSFTNPYGLGGLGGSTAEFLSLYLFTKDLLKLPTLSNKDFVAFYQSLNSHHGTPPSGADLIAQYHGGISYFNPMMQYQTSHTWPFEDLSLLLFHTNQKLATHEHLQKLALTHQTKVLTPIAKKGYAAFKDKNSHAFIDAIKQYGKTLGELSLTASHTKKILNECHAIPEILAAKGCGALGADIILVLCAPPNKQRLINQLQTKKFPFIADETSLSKLRKASNRPQKKPANLK